MIKSVKREYKSCFISAPYGADLGALTSVLEGLEVDWQWAKNDIEFFDRLPGDLRRTIRGVDFVIGVLGGDDRDQNTMFEIGLAIGLNKPVFVILTSSQEPPSELSAIQHLKSPLTDREALEFHLSLFVRTRQKTLWPSSSRRRRSKPSAEKWSSHIGDIRSHASRPSNALEAEICNLVSQAGGKFLIEPELADEGRRYIPDLLIWLDVQSREFLNPAAVELKTGPIGRSQLRQAAGQLSRFLETSRIRSGLLLVQNQVNPDFIGSASLNVFILSVDQFRDLLLADRLDEFLRSERNKAAHGIR